MKFEYYNENTEVVDEQLVELKKQMRNQGEGIIFRASEVLNERGDSLNYYLQQKLEEKENEQT